VSGVSPTLPILELRQYTLHPGRRDELIELFERELVESQEAVGMEVAGHFRDLDDPDRFVWLRGFADLAARLAGLTAFYGGPVWQAHRGAANATMIDSDDVRLLGEARPGSGLSWPIAPARPSRTPRDRAGSRSEPRALIEVTSYALARAAEEPLRARFCEELGPLLRDHGGALLGVYKTLAVTNDFPRLPVRTGEWALTTVARFADDEAHARATTEIAGAAIWNQRFAALLREQQAPDGAVPVVERRRLAPAARSLLA
jgi:NIPSNAP